MTFPGVDHDGTAACPPCADGEHVDDNTDPICPCCGVEVPTPEPPWDTLEEKAGLR
jgi:hypothetical protein